MQIAQSTPAKGDAVTSSTPARIPAVLVLADGRIVEDCTPADFLADRRRWAQADRAAHGAAGRPRRARSDGR